MVHFGSTFRWSILKSFSGFAQGLVVRLRSTFRWSNLKSFSGFAQGLVVAHFGSSAPSTNQLLSY